MNPLWMNPLTQSQCSVANFSRSTFLTNSVNINPICPHYRKVKHTLIPVVFSVLYWSLPSANHCSAVTCVLQQSAGDLIWSCSFHCYQGTSANMQAPYKKARHSCDHAGHPAKLQHLAYILDPIRACSHTATYRGSHSYWDFLTQGKYIPSYLM